MIDYLSNTPAGTVRDLLIESGYRAPSLQGIYKWRYRGVPARWVSAIADQARAAGYEISPDEERLTRESALVSEKTHNSDAAS